MFIKVAAFMLGYSDWRSMGSYKAALPGVFAEDLARDRHNVEALSRPTSSGNIATPSFCCMTVSLLDLTQHCSKSLAEDVAALLIPQLIGLVV